MSNKPKTKEEENELNAVKFENMKKLLESFEKDEKNIEISTNSLKREINCFIFLIIGFIFFFYFYFSYLNSSDFENFKKKNLKFIKRRLDFEIRENKNLIIDSISKTSENV